MLDQICQKRVFLVSSRKSEYYHWILYIRISLGTKFQLKVTILIFWTKFAQKGELWSETEKSHLCVHPWSLLTTLPEKKSRHKISSVKKIVGKNFVTGKIICHFLPAIFFAWLSGNNWIKKILISYLDHSWFC